MHIPNVALLNLPKPSHAVLDALQDAASCTQTDPDARRWLNEFYSGEINAVDQLFAPVDAVLNAKLQAEYAQFFNRPITFVLGVMRSPNGAPACLPPHIDRARSLAINYYFDLGGTQVSTVFYDYIQSTHPDAAKNLLYRELNQVRSCTFNINSWYAYDVNRAHSVENIVSVRYFFGIVFTDCAASYKLSDFNNEYPELVLELISY